MSLTVTAPPELTSEVLDVTVREGAVPDPWDAPIRNAWLCADEDSLLLRQAEAAVFVTGGAEVVMWSVDRRTRSAFDFLVYAVAARALLWQRRLFSLHAVSLAATTGQAVVLMGHSGAGKSTTAVELLSRPGWSLVADDLSLVTGAQGTAVVSGYRRPIHLADEQASRLGVDPTVGRRLPHRDKRVYAVDIEPRQIPVSTLVELHQEPEQPPVRQMPAARALVAIARHADPSGVCHLPGIRQELLAWAARLASVTPALTISRGGRSPHQVASALENFVMPSAGSGDDVAAQREVGVAGDAGRS